MEKSTPLALFAYNRPKHIVRALESVAACRRLEECHVLIFCDGTKNTDDIESVRQTREAVYDWAKVYKAEVIEREKNLGLARSIVTGVSDLCREHGRVIVVEDDLVVSPDFVDYMLQGLDRYEEQPEVYQVSGCSLVETTSDGQAYFLPLTTTWGWGTWERAWKAFTWEPDGVLDILSKTDTRHCFDLNGTCAYSAMLEDRLAGRNDSWGILWWWAVFQLKGLVLYPPRSLVFNGGFDNTGVHCGEGSVFKQEPLEAFRRPRLKENWGFPSSTEPDPTALDLVKTALGSVLTPMEATLFNRWSSKIKKFFRQTAPNHAETDSAGQ